MPYVFNQDDLYQIWAQLTGNPLITAYTFNQTDLKEIFDALQAGTVTGSGSTNRMTKWTAANIIGNSDFANDTNSFYPITSGSEIGKTGTPITKKRIGKLFIDGIVDYEGISLLQITLDGEADTAATFDENGYVNLKQIKGNIDGIGQPRMGLRKNNGNEYQWMYDTDLGYNVKDYGLTGDGVTNDRNALNTLLNTTAPEGSTIYFPPGTYLISSNVTTNKTFNYVGANGAILKTTSNDQILVLTSGAEKSRFENLFFLGNDTAGSQYGIYFNGAGSCQIKGCYFRDFGQGGILFNAISTSPELGALVLGCKFYSNNHGINSIDTGEYVQVIGCDFNGNTIAIKTIGGNWIIDGNNIDYNTNGIEISGTGGTNPGKCIISNNTINHTTSNAIYLHDFTSGCVLQNNIIIIGTVSIVSTTGVSIVGGLINVDAYTLTTNTGLIFSQVRFPASLANTISLTGTAPYYIDCYKLDGSYATDADNFTVASAQYGTYTPTLTGVSNVASTSASACQWLRVGNTVTVSGRVRVTPTLAGGVTTEVGVSLPVASNFANIYECAGSGAAYLLNTSCTFIADTTNDRAQLTFLSNGIIAEDYYFSFTYKII